MKRTTVVRVLLAMITALTVVLVLYVTTEKKINHQYASFNRTFVTDALTATDTLHLNAYNLSIAGHTQHTVYLANPKNPFRLIAVDKNLQDTTHYLLRVDTDSLVYRAMGVTVDSPYFYLADGVQPFIYKGVLRDREATAWITDIRFTKAIPFSASSAALISILHYENTVVKKVRGKTPEVYPDILEEQGEGIFSTDGMLLYDKTHRLFVYVYYYRNQYMVFDTTFQTVYRGHTADSISQAKIKTATIRSQNSRTMAAPPLKVNNHCAADNTLLYVHSNILARNEDPYVFERNSVVDVYTPDTQTYLYSFYVPAFNTQPLKEFILIDQHLYVLYGPYLVRYRLHTVHDTIA